MYPLYERMASDPPHKPPQTGGQPEAKPSGSPTAKAGVPPVASAPPGARLNPAASAAVRALASALRLPAPEDFPGPSEGGASPPPGTNAGKPATVPSPVPATARKPPTSGGDPSPYAGGALASPGRPPQAGSAQRGVATPRAPASPVSRAGVASRGPVSTPPAPAKVGGAVATPPVPDDSLGKSPAPRSRRRLVLLLVMGGLLVAGGAFLLTYRSSETRWQGVLAALPGSRAHKAKSTPPRVEAHFDRNAVADSLMVGDRLIALNHSGVLVAFNRSTFAPLGERVARHRFVCIAPGDSTHFSAGLSNGAIVKIKAEDLTVSQVGKVPGRPEWIGQRRAGGGLLVVYSNPRRAALGSLDHRGYAHKLKDLGAGKEYALDAPGNIYLDSKDRLWVVSGRDRSPVRLQVLDLQTGTPREIAGKNAWTGLRGIVELPDGQVWAFGGTSQAGGPSSFVARVEANGKSTPLWTASAERLAGAPGTPILQVVVGPGRQGAVAISAAEVVEVDPSARQWKPLGSTGLQMQVASTRASGRAHLDGDRVIMGLATGGFLEIAPGQARRHVLEGQNTLLLPTEIRPMAGGLAFYGYGGPLLYANGAWRAAPETVAPPRDLMGAGRGEAGERVWASLVSLPVNPTTNVVVAKAGVRRWSNQHMHGIKDTFVTGKWIAGNFKVMSQEDLALEPDDTFVTPDGQLWNVDDQGLWNFSVGKWRMVMSRPGSHHGGGGTWGEEGAGLRSVNSAVGESLRFVDEVGPPWVGLPHGSFTWAMARLDLNEAGGIPLIDEIPVSIDGKRVQIRDAISWSKGRLLLATNQGLCLFDLRWGNCQVLAPQGLDDEVVVILRDRAKRVWLGGRGLWQLEDEKRARPVHPFIPALAHADVVAMAEAPEGGLAVGLAGRGVVILDVPRKGEAPAKPKLESWDEPGSFEGRYADQAIMIRTCKQVTDPTALLEQAQALDGLKAQLADAVLGGDARVHLGDEAALDRRPDLGVYGPEIDKLEGSVVATLKKSPLWNDLGVSKRYGPRGSRSVEVKTCPSVDGNPEATRPARPVGTTR